ncbi:MAG: hypothetical protein IJO09_05345 [Oscillospiraceae bacterium]|nr:hypothetical protein [Oscillospiraceae bacterium]
MTAYDIYKRACTLMFEEAGEDSSFYENFVGILNPLICEALPYENSVRRSEGRKELVTPPEVKLMNDMVDMCGEICNIALPYGVAACFCRDDGELYDSETYRNRFIDALHTAAKVSFSEIEDIYGEGV